MLSSIVYKDNALGNEVTGTGRDLVFIYYDHGTTERSFNAIER